MTDMRAWIRERAEQDERLYEHYGKPLEAEHTGEFVVISSDGEIMFGSDDVRLGDQALERFGRWNFAFRRVGYPLEERFPFRRVP